MNQRNPEAETYFKKALDITFCSVRGGSVIVKDTIKKGLYIFGRTRDSFQKTDKGIKIIRGET